MNKSWEEYTINKTNIKFPFKPYQSQLVLMSKIIQSIENNKNALLESPTGTGKTLALLSSTLAWQEKQKATIRKLKAEMINKKKVIKQEETNKKLTTSDLFEKFSNPLENTYHKDQNIEDFEDFKPETYTKLEESKIELKKKLNLPTIYFGTRTHKQIAQIVKELKKNTPYRPKMSILGSRDQFCINNKISKLNSKDEECQKATSKDECIYNLRQGPLKLAGKIYVSSNCEEIKEPIIWDVEELASLGKIHKGCPFYASRVLADSAEIVFCPYNYLLHPRIRESSNIRLENSIVVLDEAHNIEDACRESISVEIELTGLDRASEELNFISNYQEYHESSKRLLMLVLLLVNFIRGCNGYFKKLEDFAKKTYVFTGKHVLIFLLNNQINKDVIKALNADLTTLDSSDNSKEKIVEVALSKGSLVCIKDVFMALDFLFRDHESYKIVIIKNKDYRSNEWIISLGFWCLNPGLLFSDISSKAKSVILTSGTLSPMVSFSSELQTEFPITYEANHVIPLSNIWAGTISFGPNNIKMSCIYSNQENLQYQDDLGESIVKILEVIQKLKALIYFLLLLK